MNNREVYLGTIQRDATVILNANRQLPVLSVFNAQQSTLKIMLTLYTYFFKSKELFNRKIPYALRHTGNF